MSTLRTFLLMAAMTALFLGVGFLIGGETGMVIAFVLALGMNVFAYWNADKLVLSMHGAREVDDRTASDLVRMVRNLSTRAGLPVPRVYIIDNPQPNAFATGRNPENAAVAATTGLLELLSREEVEGVMAHELAHIRNRDTLTMTITATLAGAISMLANFAFFFGSNRNNPLGIVGTLLVMILAPLAAMLVQMAISRTREYAADKTGAEICGNPRALAGALDKLGRGVKARPNPVAERNPATAHLFIANPLSGQNFDSLFSTHPRMEERIRRLRDMAGPLDIRQTERYARPENFYAGPSGIPDSDRHKNRRKKGPWG